MSGLTGPMCAARVWEMSAIVLLGILGGLLGALMVVLNGYGLARWRKKHMGGPMVKQKKLVHPFPFPQSRTRH